MIIRAIDDNLDWTFGKGKSSYKSNLLALIQDVETRLREWKGDCFFDNNAGVDWKNRLAKRAQVTPLREEVRTVILKSDGVVEVINLDLSFNSISRGLTLNYSLKTIYSAEAVSNSIEV